MKVFSICGYSDSGKTTTAEYLIRELRARGYSVGSMKEIHYEDFALDGNTASDTARHRSAGAGLVCARGLRETDVMFQEKLDARKILHFYGEYDYVLCESVRDLPMPMIVTASSREDLDMNWNSFIFCVSGRIADQIDSYRDVPAISAVTDVSALADLVEERVYEILPNVEPARCGLCGGDCRTMGVHILRGLAKRADCAASQGPEIYANGERITLVPFVQKVFQGAVMGILKELKGYEDGVIEIRIKTG